MFEKIKAWIKRKRETAREQQAADRLIKHIEQALGYTKRHFRNAKLILVGLAHDYSALGHTPL